MQKTFRILVAMNAFKGTLTARQAGSAVARGIRAAWNGRRPVRILQMPVADGGDGFAEVLCGALGGTWVRRRVGDPLGRSITARFAHARARRMAVIELARASGLALLQRRNAMRASTLGTGQLLRAALELGARRILLGIGGSASTDGGTGIAQALGVRLLDGRGGQVPPCGAGLALLEHIDMSAIHPAMASGRVQLDVACDVENVLFGPRGAAHVFAPQKGASARQVAALDQGLRNFARIIRRDLHVDVRTMPGGGAAGGSGAGVVALLGGRLRPGFELVAETIGLKEAMARADLVITGEGRLDASSTHGKAPVGVLRLAQKSGVPVAAIAGQLGPGAEALGFKHVLAASQERVPADKHTAMQQLADAARNLVASW